MLSVSTVPHDRRHEALRLLLRDFPLDEREQRAEELLSGSGETAVSLDGLLMAELDGELAGVAISMAQADGTVFVWPPVLSIADPQIADALLQETRRRLDRSRAWIGQAVIETTQGEERDALTRNGFPLLTELEFLQRPCSTILESPPGTALISHEYSVDVHQRFVHVLEQTYVATLDCPELSGVRTAEQALAGHRLNGDFAAARWRIYTEAGCDVGVLLMTQHDPALWEVVYLGILPTHRGRGFGRAVLYDGLQRAEVAGVKSVVLAVDVRNTYARRLYSHMGFEYLTTRAVHARLISTRD